jgi:hypothetical protein
MTMTIRTTQTPGLYQARFNFDAIEGVMMLSTNETLLKAFVTEARIDLGDNSDPLGNETGMRERVLERMARKRILKRKRRRADGGGKLNGTAAKKAKNGRRGRPSRYFFWVRCPDLGNYKICNVGKGTVKFHGPGLTGFTGQGGLGGIGDDVVFSGRKVAGGGGSDDEDDEKDAEDYAWDMFSG